MRVMGDLARIEVEEAVVLADVVEQKAVLPVAAYKLPKLLSRFEAEAVMRETTAFATGPDSVDLLPTFECFIFHRGEVLCDGSCRALEGAILGRALPYLRERFGCSSLELSQALVRRYLPSERREHPAHFDAHALVTMVRPRVASSAGS